LQHAETRLALEADVKHLVLERDELQLQLQKLQADHIGLQETAHAVVEMQETREAEQLELRARVAQLETEKAVLQSKVDQVQKADAQLRGKIQTLDELVLQLQQEKQVLQNENTELGKIATDLMDMAEQQHAQKQEILKTPDKDGDERLARTRTRLRESLG
jgi:prophage DNA circulation protein